MNIALVGLGMVAQTHVDAIRDAGLNLVKVMGRNPGRTHAFAQRVGAIACDNIHDIAKDPNIDFVIVATPPDARLELVNTLAAAGKPILMEKPIERTVQAATEIVSICAAYNVPLGIVFQHRMRAGSLALKNAFQTDVLGSIATVELRVPWWRDQSYYDATGRGSYDRDGGGVMISQAIHTLDLAIWLLGPIRSVQSLLRTTKLHRMEAEDWAGALLEFESGAIGSFLATTAAFPGAAESITIQGSKTAAHLAYAAPWRGTWAGECGGAVLSHAIHNHDLLTHIMGPVAKVSAMTATCVNPIETEDCAAISFQMENGALCTSSITLGAASDETRLRFVFEHLTATSGSAPYAPGLDKWTFVARDSKDQSKIDRALQNAPPTLLGFSGFFAEIAKALGSVQNDAVTLDQGATSVALVTAIYHAARSGTCVNLPITADHPLYEGWQP